MLSWDKTFELIYKITFTSIILTFELGHSISYKTAFELMKDSDHPAFMHSVGSLESRVFRQTVKTLISLHRCIG